MYKFPSLRSARLRGLPALIIGTFWLARSAWAATPAQPDEAVVEALRSAYAALSEENLDRWRSVTATTFHAYDAGLSLDREQLFELIRTKHAAGTGFRWTVTEARVHRIGRTAWVVYVNRGEVSDSHGVTPMVWLESAVLERQSGVWRVVFLHSSRVAVSSPS